MKTKGVTTQMKALDQYVLVVVFTLLLNRLHAFANFMFNLDREMWQWKGLCFPMTYFTEFKIIPA